MPTRDWGRIIIGLLIVAVGAAFLVVNAGSGFWSYVWPAAIIVSGLFVLSRRGGAIAQTRSSDVVVAAGLLGGPEIASASQNFRGGTLTGVLGGVTLDLRGAHPAPEGASINATAVLGGIDIIVPHGWRIAITATPILGGIADKTDHDHAPSPDAPLLTIDGLSILGGIDVKHSK